MNWVLQVLVWWFFLFLLGIVFFPLAKKLFGKFFDFGYPFAKPLAIAILSYAAFFFSLIHVLPFAQWSLFLLIIAAAIINYKFLFKKSDLTELLQKPLSDKLTFIFEEVFFVFGLLFLAFIRGQEPSIHGLEKFMDFGFMNSILHTKYFPPLDMWYSAGPNLQGVDHAQGYPINYYFFGHVTGAFLMKLTSVSPFIGYNLILATIFAQGITLVFSLGANIVGFAQSFMKQTRQLPITKFVIGIVASYIINLGGNLHTIYLFTKGYPNDSPVPFWKIWGGFHPETYWYPNATRFIPFTIHEFPSYSYVVADLHGHVFDIPFVLLTIAILFHFFVTFMNPDTEESSTPQSKKHKKGTSQQMKSPKQSFVKNSFWTSPFIKTYSLPILVLLGFLDAVHYMTNAFDVLIYLSLTAILLFILFRFTQKFFISIGIVVGSFILFFLPFSINFKPFVSGIGVNCAPKFLVAMQKFGPFLFEKGNCQVSPPWMLLVLWGFFLINFVLFATILTFFKEKKTRVDLFMLSLFGLGTFLLIVPEFFYFKDIYPQHFRANTMFKLGYQAFIMMGIASVYTLYQINLIKGKIQWLYKAIFVVIFGLIFMYPYFAFPSYYGNMKRPVDLDGSTWLNSLYPESKELINYINKNIPDQAIILEAQGDSYTDFDLISAFTGHPTVAGWWVHEWLWRGSPDVVGKRIPDIQAIYQSNDVAASLQLLQKYHVQYVVISPLERQKYTMINESIFKLIGKKVFTSKNSKAVLYKIAQ